MIGPYLAVASEPPPIGQPQGGGALQHRSRGVAERRPHTPDLSPTHLRRQASQVGDPLCPRAHVLKQRPDNGPCCAKCESFDFLQAIPVGRFSCVSAGRASGVEVACFSVFAVQSGTPSRLILDQTPVGAGCRHTSWSPRLVETLSPPLILLLPVAGPSFDCCRPQSRSFPGFIANEDFARSLCS